MSKAKLFRQIVLGANVWAAVVMLWHMATEGFILPPRPEPLDATVVAITMFVWVVATAWALFSVDENKLD